MGNAIWGCTTNTNALSNSFSGEKIPMGNCKVENPTQNNQKSARRTNYALGIQTPTPDQTLQRKASSKIEITITHKQLSEATWLFKQYGKRKPDWLRQKFNLDQRRKKCINTELIEAQLDCTFCGHYQNTDEWYDLLHLLWHEINGEPSCV